jgi:hypothetical protein
MAPVRPAEGAARAEGAPRVRNGRPGTRPLTRPDPCPVQRAVATQAAVEIATVAGEIEFIASTAFTMFGITLVVRLVWGSGLGRKLWVGWVRR